MRDNEDYQRWKATLLSTEAGREQWDRYANDENFTLRIEVSEEKGQSAEVHGYCFDGEQVVAATMTLGIKLDSGVPSEGDYPILSSFATSPHEKHTMGRGELRESGDILAATKMMHEFGHINDTIANGKAQYLGAALFVSGAGAAARLLVGTETGKALGNVANAVSRANEHRAEANTREFLRQALPGNKMHSKIRSAIERFEKTRMGAIP